MAQARTDAVRTELQQNADNAGIRAATIEKAIRDLGGFPDVIGPFLGRAAAAVKALTEQAEPFDEALLGDLALEGQLLDRARYVKALSVAREAQGRRRTGDPPDHRAFGDGGMADDGSRRGRPRRSRRAAPDPAAGRRRAGRQVRQLCR